MKEGREMDKSADPLLKLPDDINAIIFSHLPFLDTWRLRCVSRHWLSALSTSALILSALRRWETHQPHESARTVADDDSNQELCHTTGTSNRQELDSSWGHRLDRLRRHCLGRPAYHKCVHNDQSGRLHHIERLGAIALHGSLLICCTTQLSHESESRINLEVADLASGQYRIFRPADVKIPVLGRPMSVHVRVSQQLIAMITESGQLLIIDLPSIQMQLRTTLTNRYVLSMAADGDCVAIITAEFDWDLPDTLIIYDRKSGTTSTLDLALPESYYSCKAFGKMSQSEANNLRRNAFHFAEVRTQTTLLVNEKDRTCTLIYFIPDIPIHEKATTGGHPFLHFRKLSFDGTDLGNSVIRYDLTFRYKPEVAADMVIRSTGVKDVIHISIEPYRVASHDVIVRLNAGGVELMHLNVMSLQPAMAFWKGRAYINREDKDIYMCKPESESSAEWSPLTCIESEERTDGVNASPPVYYAILANESFLVLLESEQEQTPYCFAFDESHDGAGFKRLLAVPSDASSDQNADASGYHWTKTRQWRPMCESCGKGPHQRQH